MSAVSQNSHIPDISSDLVHVHGLTTRTMYRTAGNIGGQLNLAVWWLGKRPSNLNPSNLSAI